MANTDTFAAVGNRVSNGQHVKDSDHNHDIEEVIHNNDHLEFPVITGRLDKPVNQRQPGRLRGPLLT